MNAPIPTKKRCQGPCGLSLPATTEYFNADSHAPCGLKSRCRKCRYAAGRLRDSPGMRVCNSRTSAEKYVPGKKPCSECNDLPWRVLGERQGNICDECGLEYAEEPPPELRLRRFDRVG